MIKPDNEALLEVSFKGKHYRTRSSVAKENDALLKSVHSGPFTFKNTYGYDHNRIYDPYKYRHFYSEDDLQTCLNEYFDNYQDVYFTAENMMSNAHLYGYFKKHTDSIEYSQNRIKYLKYLIYFINLNLVRFYDLQEDSEDEAMSSKIDILNT